MSADWYSRRSLGNFSLLVATALVFYLCWRLLLPFVAVITWSLALCVMTRPLFLALRRRLGNPSLVALLCVILVGAVMLGPGVLLVTQVAGESAGMADWVRDEVESGRLLAHFEKVPSVRDAIDRAISAFDLRAELRRIAGLLANFGKSLLVGSSWFLTQFILTLFALFFALRDFELAHRALRGLLPLTDAEMDLLFHRLSNTVYAAIYGKFAAAFAQGSLGGLMFWMLGLPAPLLWGLAMALFALVPMMGPAVIWVPAALSLLYQGAWVKALIMAGWGVLVVGLIDNFIFPMVVGGTLQLHTLLAFFATFGGLIAFGLSGLVLGPIVLALTMALIQIWKDRTSAPA